MTWDDADNPWAHAAEALRLRVARRERLSRFLPPFAIAVGTGTLLVIGLRWAGLSPVGLDPRWLLPLFGVAGAWVGTRRARDTAVPATGIAAWALDRMAGTKERGLAAALFQGEQGVVVREVRPRLGPPPAVRLLPPKGLVFTAGVLLLAGLSLFLSPPAATVAEGAGMSAAAASTATRGATRSDDAELTAAESEVQTLASEQERMRALREALGLRPDRTPDAAEVKQALSDPARRLAVQEAARDQPSLRRALEGEDTEAAGTAVQDALAGAMRQAQALELARQRAARLRTQSGRMRVPPARRALVERYFAQELETDADLTPDGG